VAKNSVSAQNQAREDEQVDSLFDVPAAVLCAFCGQADCAGCSPADTNASGVIAIVPWERPGSGVFSRLFSTAKATTIGAEAFFAALPDGEIPPAMRFAVIAELLAVISLAAVLIPLAAFAAPDIALALLHNPAARATALRVILLSVPALALWMVAAHVTHGAALDVGARKQGVPPQRRRAVRFGLYACGWDLMAGPLGALVILFSHGIRSIGTLVDATMRAPGKSSVAFLEGVHRLTPDKLARARRYGTFAAVMLAIVSALVFLAALGVAILF